MDKFKRLYKMNKKAILCVFIISIVGIIAGSLFLTVLKSSDKETVINYISEYFDSIKSNSLDYSGALKSGLITNICYVFIIWIMGISIIGLPVALIFYFTKTFILGFSVMSIISCYGLKGCIYAFIYIFPHQVINLIFFSILCIYAIVCSCKLTSTIVKKKMIDFNGFMKKYRYILVVCLLAVIVTSLYDTFAVPNILKMVLYFIK